MRIKNSPHSSTPRNSIVGSIELLSTSASIICFRTLQSKHSVLIDGPFCEETFHTNPVSPTAALERDEFYRQLHAALPALTPSQRRVFILRYKEDLSLKAIAHRLGRSIGTVKAHLFHARRSLLYQLKDFYRPGISIAVAVRSFDSIRSVDPLLGFTILLRS